MTIEPIVQSSTAINADFWLAAAHGSVRRECGWHVAPVIEETLVLDGSGGDTLLLRSGRVVELLEVLNDGTDVTADVDFSRAGILELRGGRWTRRLGRISVKLRHGYETDEVPEVAALIATLARRGASSPGIVANQSVNGSSVGYLTAGGAPISIPLLEIERRTLDPYRLVWEA
ncbi:hypothetical protein [Microbacterium sp. NPDC089696]|uniref:hypothetical protein n=1 Tax=Microbacterium sp. NPDC089696 TaxID=3364199 RepID=UPI0038249A21